MIDNHSAQLLSQSLDDLGTTLGECLGRTQWSSLLDLTTYLYYFTSGCVPIITQSHVLLVTNFIRPYLRQFFDDSHGLKASLKPLRRPFDRCQSRLEEINIG